MSLMAAGRASIRCRARHTSPMPPCPAAPPVGSSPFRGPRPPPDPGRRPPGPRRRPSRRRGRDRARLEVRVGAAITLPQRSSSSSASGDIAAATMAAASIRRGGPGMISGNSAMTVGHPGERRDHAVVVVPLPHGGERDREAHHHLPDQHQREQPGRRRIAPAGGPPDDRRSHRDRRIRQHEARAGVELGRRLVSPQHTDAPAHHEQHRPDREGEEQQQRQQANPSPDLLEQVPRQRRDPGRVARGRLWAEECDVIVHAGHTRFDRDADAGGPGIAAPLVSRKDSTAGDSVPSAVHSASPYSGAVPDSSR